MQNGGRPKPVADIGALLSNIKKECHADIRYDKKDEYFLGKK